MHHDLHAVLSGRCVLDVRCRVNFCSWQPPKFWTVIIWVSVPWWMASERQFCSLAFAPRWHFCWLCMCFFCCLCLFDHGWWKLWIPLSTRNCQLAGCNPKLVHSIRVYKVISMSQCLVDLCRSDIVLSAYLGCVSVLRIQLTDNVRTFSFSTCEGVFVQTTTYASVFLLFFSLRYNKNRISILTRLMSVFANCSSNRQTVTKVFTCVPWVCWSSKNCSIAVMIILMMEATSCRLQSYELNQTECSRWLLHFRL